jgi:S1-C subfamily serine protease
MTRNWLLVCVVLSALSACAGSPGIVSDGGPKGVDASWMDGVRKNIAAEKYPQAYQDLSFLERNPVAGVSAEEVSGLKERVASDLGQSFQKKIEQRQFEDAYALLLSLQAIGRMELAGDWTPARLFQALSAQRSEAGEKPTALLYALRALALDGANPELLRLLLGLSADLGNNSVYRDTSARMAELGLTVPEELAGRAPVTPPMEKMVRGTVTIWVDRGIKIERGVGLPDRVIGSGFFIDPRGYLLTNYHVIESEVDPKYEGYSRLYIRPSDKVEEKIPAKVVGYDRIFDLALVKVEVTPQYVFTFEGDPQLKVGSAVLTIGSPAGLENSVTSGIVSAAGRRFLQMGDAMQVDAPVNPGNSGGPLLNSQGQLVGVVFAGLQQFQGVNFAIPFIWANKVLRELYDGGEAKHPWLGLAAQETDAGLEVVYAAPGGPADRAGIKQGDVLLSLNGAAVHKLVEVQSALLDLAAPCLVSLGWKREGKAQSGQVSLSERPFSPIEESLGKDSRQNVLYPLFGMKLEKTGSFLWRASYVVDKVLAGSVADETGLSPGDPVSLMGWKVDKESRYVVAVLFVKKRKAGFLESAIQMAAYLESDNFI